MRELCSKETQAVAGSGLIGNIVKGILVKKAIDKAVKHQIGQQKGHPHQVQLPHLKVHFPK